MAVKAKGKRKIIVKYKNYMWYVKSDDDSPYHILNVISDDKSLIVSCPIETETKYIISKGNVFQNKHTNGQWNRYLLPFSVPDIITPKFVADVIYWTTHGDNAEKTEWNGKDVPV
ncbi:MAG: hypothetical protein PUG48_08150 [Clostridia bacterium]|nr:hypothetical protein [Clostridia bacterium]